MPVQNRTDTQGRFFTDLATKEPVRVLVQTASHVLVGTVYIRREHRLLDELNDGPGDFLAMTDVWVFHEDTAALRYTANFLALSKAQVHLVVPVDELTMDTDTGWLSGLKDALTKPQPEVENE